MKKFVIADDLNYKKHKVSVKSLSFRPSVYGLLFKGGKILLSRQWDGYDFPGGGMLIYETIEEALQREFWEETGLKIRKGKIVSVEGSFFTMPFTKRNVNSVCLYFLVKNPKGKISTKNLDQQEKQYAQAAEWVDIKKVKKIKFYNSVPDSVKLISNARRILKHA